MSEQITPKFEDEETITGIPVHVRRSDAAEAPNIPDEPPRDTMYGGYTGVRVGEMGRRINDLHAAGRHDEANALTDQLNSNS